MRALIDLIQIDVVKDALAFIEQRRRPLAARRNQDAEYQILRAVQRVAKAEQTTPASLHDALEELVHRYRPRDLAIPEQTRELIHAMADPEQFAHLIDLPLRLYAEIDGKNDVPSAARADLTAAAALAFALAAPGWPGDIARATLNDTLVKTQRDGTAILVAHWKKHTHKFGSEVEIEIDPIFARILRTYIDRVRSPADKAGTQYLFPGRGTDFAVALSQAVRRLTMKHLGIAINLSSVRPIVAAALIDADAKFTVAAGQLLGHKQRKTIDRIAGLH